jgi:hypothetical protein
MYAVRRGMGSAGLGDTTVTLPSGKSVTFDADGNWVQGFGCWMMGLLGGLVNANCVPPTSAELSQAIGISDIGPNVSPDLRAQMIADQNASVASDCAAHPTLCNAQVDAGSAVVAATEQVAAPLVNLTKGAVQTAEDIGNALKCGVFQTAQQQDDGSYVCATNWALWGGIAIVGMFALAVIGGGSPRRYGR